MVSSKNKGSGSSPNNSSNSNGKVSATIRSRMRRPPAIQTTDNTKDSDVVSTLPSSNGQIKITQGLKNTPASKKGSVTTLSSTPYGMRGTKDIRSPGVEKTPTNDANDTSPIPDFITQTDKYGNASTPRTAPVTPASPTSDIQSTGTDDTDHEEPEEDGYENDACETLLESLRMMCCCLLPAPSAHPQDDSHVDIYATPDAKSSSSSTGARRCLTVPKSQISMREKQDPTLDIRLLPTLTPRHKNYGRKCLVLDLDETLVHSSFRAVQGADFVIPVQIEEVVHFVYVMKRPGVDEFLVEMAKHYEVVIYTASLNKYADPLLDLLDPHNTISYRLFRESCVFHEGNYVKDLSLVNRDLSQTIIVDNSPSSYTFHPESAIDCSSYIDDPKDVELNQIGSFLTGVRHVKDVRNVCNLWREWPNVPTHLMKRGNTSSTLNEEHDVEPGYWSNGSGQQYLETRQDVGNRQ